MKNPPNEDEQLMEMLQQVADTVIYFENSPHPRYPNGKKYKKEEVMSIFVEVGNGLIYAAGGEFKERFLQYLEDTHRKYDSLVNFKSFGSPDYDERFIKFLPIQLLIEFAKMCVDAPETFIEYAKSQREKISLLEKMCDYYNELKDKAEGKSHGQEDAQDYQED